MTPTQETNPLHEMPLEQMVAEHLRLKNSLGANHPVVVSLWGVIQKKRSEEPDTAAQ